MDSKWILGPKGELLGIALGSDFCAEHEWGVESMRKQLGCDASKDGIERRIIHTLPIDLRLFKDFAIFLSPKKDYYKQPEDWLKGELKPYRDEELVCAWDEKTFGIAAYTPASKDKLGILWRAFQRKDVAFWTNVGPFHLGGGLIFGIVSKLGEGDKKDMLEKDLEVKRIKALVEKTGIEEKLKKAKKSYYALSPKSSESFKNHTSKYPIVFWLNPQEQHLYNYGWFTLEDLELWADNKGPIMMTEEQRKERRR
jgi:hypothetical protein